MNSKYTAFGVLVLFLICVAIDGCSTGGSSLRKRPAKTRARALGPGIPPSCEASLKSDCGATQKKMAMAFRESIGKFGLADKPAKPKGGPPALDVLPKDEFGLINWTKAVMAGTIMPLDSIDGIPVQEETSDLYVLFPADVVIMADVVFPHNIHTYWLSCKNCHPKIFKPEVGGNPVSMKAIEKGQFCGRCHGKVAFPFETLDERKTCRRCHFFLKKY